MMNLGGLPTARKVSLFSAFMSGGFFESHLQQVRQGKNQLTSGENMRKTINFYYLSSRVFYMNTFNVNGFNVLIFCPLDSYHSMGFVVFLPDHSVWFIYNPAHSIPVHYMVEEGKDLFSSRKTIHVTNVIAPCRSSKRLEDPYLPEGFSVALIAQTSLGKAEIVFEVYHRMIHVRNIILHHI